ncbi:diacylglycerol O-acyltransferase 2-like protein 6 [Bradysia coprophila]|uniref:diacylglycerol O-acyltransferase 2-like protein 6 n=1 Tax=Bradysia coprophila TaxID=38358 RepID=UPI00187D7BA9|nr:diacylglycerol O-acyltransferase 2-like protein 6 [Bradysia coprophila]
MASLDDFQRIIIPVLFLFTLLIFALSLPVLIVLVIFGNVYVKVVCSIYLVFYISGFLRKVTDRGGRRACQWVRNWWLWKWLLNYFPVDLVKTADLSPDHNYLICIFPHGYLSIGAFLNFASNHSKWSTLFPGIRPRLTSLVMNFNFPASRELYLSLGKSTVSAASLTALLTQSNDPRDPSNRDGCTASAVGLIVGGEREQRIAANDTYKFVLKNRKGFVRIALKTGASLVPAISFGENNTFDLNGWRFRFNGRVPITTVVGAPIRVQKNPHPDDDEVNEVHELFCKAIRVLFEEHKGHYVENSDKVQLELV